MTETELTTRLERLERDNRRLKGLAVAVLVLAAGLSLYDAAGVHAAPQSVPEKISAHEFDVVDSLGTPRIIMGSDPDTQTHGGPFIRLYDAKGVQRLMMEVSSDTSEVGGPSVWLLDAKGELRALMGLSPDGLSSLNFFADRGRAGARIEVLPTGAPDITLRDPQGFEMHLGHTETVTPKTGQTQQTSAASIVMFGNDEKHHIIWQAP